MLELKVRVPKHEDITGSTESRISKNSIDIISRQEIHELIEKKAFELGYDKSPIIQDYTLPVYVMLKDGIHGTCSEIVFVRESEATEIIWQNLLKLTPEDVRAPSVLEKDKPRTMIEKNEIPLDLRGSLNETFNDSLGSLTITGGERGLLTSIVTLTEENQRLKGLVKITERNELARDLLKVMLAKPGLGEEINALEKKTGQDLGVSVYAKLAIELADEFVKQVGE